MSSANIITSFVAAHGSLLKAKTGKILTTRIEQMKTKSFLTIILPLQFAGQDLFISKPKGRHRQLKIHFQSNRRLLSLTRVILSLDTTKRTPLMQIRVPHHFKLLKPLLTYDGFGCIKLAHTERTKLMAKNTRDTTSSMLKTKA